MNARHPQAAVRVWDVWVRLGHWALVLGVATAWLSYQEMTWHELAGYAVWLVALLRLIWGLVGPRHARFAQFVHGPRVLLAYAAQVRSHSEPRYLGHNPLGGWMIVALLATLLVACLSGWLYTTDRFWGVAWVGELHAWSANALLGLAALHVCGVLFSSWRHRENLVAAMVHGKKSAAGPHDVA